MMAGLPIHQQMGGGQQRTGGFSGMQNRSNASMGGRQAPGHIMNSGAVRFQSNAQSRSAAYTPHARNMPQNVKNIFRFLSSVLILIYFRCNLECQCNEYINFCCWSRPANTSGTC